MYFDPQELRVGRGLEHLHPWAARQALEMRFEGLQACTKFF